MTVNDIMKRANEIFVSAAGTGTGSMPSNPNKYFPRRSKQLHPNSTETKRVDTTTRRTTSPTSTIEPPSADTPYATDAHLRHHRYTSKETISPKRSHRRNYSEGEVLLPKPQPEKQEHRRLASCCPGAIRKTIPDDNSDSVAMNDILEDLFPKPNPSTSKRHARGASDGVLKESSIASKQHNRVVSSPCPATSASNEDDLGQLNCVLSERIARYGKDHPKTALSWNNIGNFYFKCGNFADALASYEEALRSYQVCFGTEHPNVAHTLSNIGTTFWRMGDFDSALPRMEQSCRIFRKTMGREHVAMGNAMHNLGQVLCLRGDNDDAMLVLRQALNIRKESLGEKHIDVARTLSLMGNVQMQRKRFDDSMKLHEEALSMKKSLLGRLHPSVLISLSDIAHVYENSHKLPEAIEKYREIVELRRVQDNSPEHHKDLGMALHAMGNAHARFGEMAEAAEALREAYIIYKQLGLHDEDRSMMALLSSIQEVNISTAERGRVFD